jgi:dTMP kinase
MLAQTEALLLTAARAQHVGEVIRPALSTGAVVVCDRFIDSTLAYQGGGHGLPLDQLLAMQELATEGLRPDVRLLFDLPVAVGLARRLRTTDEVNRIDRAAIAFHERVRDAYLELAQADPDGWAVIDASRPIDDVADQVRDVVVSRLHLPLAHTGND